MSGGGNAFIPIAISLGGAVIGIVAIIVAFSRSGGASAEVQSELERLRESNLALTAQVEELRQAHARDLQEAQKNIFELKNSTQGAVDQIGNVIGQLNQRQGANTEKIAEVVKTLNEWAARGSTPAPARTAATRSSATGGAGGSATAPADTRGAAPAGVSGAGGTAAIAREHAIESGDTFSKLAKRYGVSVSAILEANPDVDPRRLMLGQKIRIPAP